MLETILKHRSIRKYKNTAIEDNVLNDILNSAVRASNTGNMQVYSIIVTKDEGVKKQLWESHFKQDMVNQAPVILTFCADINRFNKWCEQSNTEPVYDNFLWFFNATIDATIAAQNASLAAEHHGLGICYLGTTTYMASKIISILDLPKGVVPVTTIVVGYPDQEPELTDRLPIEAVVHYDKYKDYTEKDIRKLHNEKDNSEDTKNLIEQNKTENLAQIFTEKRYVKKDNLFFSQSFLDVLKEQKFMNNK